MNIVNVYSKSNCPACEALKRKLNAAKIEYNIQDIGTNMEALDLLIENGMMSVPQLEVNGIFCNKADYDFVINSLKA